MIDFIISHIDSILAIAGIIGVVVHCAVNGVNCNTDEFPKRWR